MILDDMNAVPLFIILLLFDRNNYIYIYNLKNVRFLSNFLDIN